MSYEFDVFISYRRHGEWPIWVRELFMPLLSHWLGEELGREPKVFVDYEIRKGDAWPHELAYALSKSRVLVALWTPTYFNSKWCKSELAHMWTRETQCGFRTKDNPKGLIFPASLHDGDNFPKDAKVIQYAELQQCSNVRIAKGSVIQEELDRRIREWMPDVARGIGYSPEFEESWSDLAFETMISLFHGKAVEQRTVPRLG